MQKAELDREREYVLFLLPLLLFQAINRGAAVAAQVKTEHSLLSLFSASEYSQRCSAISPESEGFRRVLGGGEGERRGEERRRGGNGCLHSSPGHGGPGRGVVRGGLGLLHAPQNPKSVAGVREDGGAGEGEGRRLGGGVPAAPEEAPRRRGRRAAEGERVPPGVGVAA